MPYDFEYSTEECVELLEIYYNKKFWKIYDNKQNCELIEGWMKLLKCLFLKIINNLLNDFEKCEEKIDKTIILQRLSEYFVTYNKIFTEILGKYKFFWIIINKFLNLTNEEGLISGFIIIAKFFPEMVTDECYPYCNNNTDCFKFEQEIYENIQEDNKMCGLYNKNKKYFLQ